MCIIFTPDDTHFAIAEAAIDHGLHVMATKPFVKTLEEHLYLNRKAKEKGVLLQIEVHKRFGMKVDYVSMNESESNFEIRINIFFDSPITTRCNVQ